VLPLYSLTCPQSFSCSGPSSRWSLSSFPAGLRRRCSPVVPCYSLLFLLDHSCRARLLRQLARPRSPSSGESLLHLRPPPCPPPSTSRCLGRSLQKEVQPVIFSYSLAAQLVRSIRFDQQVLSSIPDPANKSHPFCSDPDTDGPRPRCCQPSSPPGAAGSSSLLRFGPSQLFLFFFMSKVSANMQILLNSYLSNRNSK
jgi:hypothetical protein